MLFLLVNGYIEFPNYVSKDGVGFIEKPDNEVLIERLELKEVEQPSDDILDAVKNKYFEKYKEAKDFLNSITTNI